MGDDEDLDRFDVTDLTREEFLQDRDDEPELVGISQDCGGVSFQKNQWRQPPPAGIRLDLGPAKP